MQTTALDVVADRLPDRGPVLAAGATARRLPLAADRLHDDDLGELPTAHYAGAVLLDHEVSRAGVHAEALIDAVGAALQPGGVVAVALRNRVFASVTGEALDGERGWSAAEATALLNHRGFSVELQCAPGAAARLRGERTFDLDADRQPGLLDAGPTLLMVARAPLDESHRTRVFHESRPRKIAAAATICRDAHGRVLVVYDRYKRIWTIPGGVVDADEDPASAARRETWEEAGVKADVGTLLGVFASRWPDRLVFVFAARGEADEPHPVHDHEIGGAEWLPWPEALDRVAPDVAYKLRRCSEQPGRTWVQ
jgi:8-oxo-dGTP pyrophosphatase MutT (NUDIX family)